MCIICDGGTPDDIFDTIDHAIDARGWAVVGVEAPPGRPCWAYTIGLEESFGHPEFVVVACRPDQGRAVLDAFADPVASGERYTAGEEILAPPFAPYKIVEVHRAQLRTPLLARRDQYPARTAGAEQWTLAPLQIVHPNLSCPDHPQEAWRLDRPSPQLATPHRPNRAERRRHRRP